MRRNAAVASAAGLIPFGHLGWGYRDRAEFLIRAAEYIADGLEHNQWVEYVGEGSPEALRAELATMPGVAERLDDIVVTPALKFYAVAPGSDVVDPETAVATRVAAVEKAIANGYTGFRAVVDATTVARRPDQRNALSCFEFLIDKQMAVLPASALCAYDTSQLADDAQAMVCLHPFVNKGSATFRLYAEPDAEMTFALTGEIDAASQEVFGTALRRVWPLSDGDTVRIDAQELEFISHPQLFLLEECARLHNHKVVLWTSQPVPTRLVDVLDLANVRVDCRTAVAEATQLREQLRQRERELESRPEAHRATLDAPQAARDRLRRTD